VQQGFARRNFLDDRLVIRRAPQPDKISARYQTFFAARQAWQQLSAGQFDQMLAAEGGHHPALQDR
jgi:hypothetical protein